MNAIKEYPFELILEPGRSIVGNTGVLLSRIEYIKENPIKNFAIIDCAMNDLLRPALYDGWHDIWPIVKNNELSALSCDVVGPVCETSDVLGCNRELAAEEGDLVALLNVGAYGFSMSSNYNSRPRAAEVLVKGDQAILIRQRENFEDLIRNEVI